jgi:hypothetical protein
VTLAAALHSVLAVVLVAGYVLLTALGHDGSALLYILGGQAAGGMIQKTTGTTDPPAIPPVPLPVKEA